MLLFLRCCFFLNQRCQSSLKTNLSFLSNRAVHLLPNRVLGVVGQHMEDFPVESLTLTSDETCIASCSHDQRVKFWNVEELKSQTVDTSKKGTKKAKKGKVKFGKAKKDDFFSGLIESTSGGGDDNEGDDSDDDDDDDDDSD